MQGAVRFFFFLFHVWRKNLNHPVGLRWVKLLFCGDAQIEFLKGVSSQTAGGEITSPPCKYGLGVRIQHLAGWECCH